MMKKKAKVLPISNEEKCKHHYHIEAHTQELSDDQLLDWLAQIAHDGKFDWGFIRTEFRRRSVQLRKVIVQHQHNYDDLWNSHYRDVDRYENEIAEMRRTHAETVEQLAELETTCKLRTDADTRAIRMWQEANPGNDHVWPDAAKLTVWLMERMVELEQDAARAKSELLAD